jgi:amino acid permease
MDWTSVFDEDGNEDLIIPQLIERRERRGRLARLVSRRYHRHDSTPSELDHDDGADDTAGFEISDVVASSSGDHGHRLLELASHYYNTDESTGGYTLRSMYLLSINYILGVGILGVPYSFAKAGFLLCLVLLCTVSLFSYMTVMWVAETGVRYQEQLKKKQRSTNNEETPLVGEGKSSHDNEILVIKASRYEVIDLVDFFLGPFQKAIYQAALLMLMYVGLLAYSQVFCNALAAILFSTLGMPQLLFGAMVIPLSCMELEEQVGVQSIMAAVRFIAIFITAFGSVMALFLDDSRSSRQHAPYFADAEPDGMMSYTYSFSGFSVAFSTFVFAQLFQHSVPGLVRPLQDCPRKTRRIPSVFGGSLLTTAAIYALLGTFAASFFGADTQSSINLNFASFTFGVDQGSASPLFMAALKFCSNIVVIFPALDTISVFPLVANTLGNNLLSSYGAWSIRKIARLLVRYNQWKDCSGLNVDVSWSDEHYDHLNAEEKRGVLEKSTEVASILWKLLASVPPVVGSIFASDLSLSLHLAGVAGIHVAFFAPSLLQIKSTLLAGNGGKTTYWGWYSSMVFCVPVLIFAAFSFVMVIWQMIGQ